MIVHNTLEAGEARIDIRQVGYFCEINGIFDIPRMVELVKLVERAILIFNAEQREQKG